MRFNALNRRVHYWVSAVVALPMLLIIGSGILLHLKKQWSWIQPTEQRGTGTAPAIGLEDLLARVRDVPGLEGTAWTDINRVDIRPGRGLAKVGLANGREVQVDLGTGRVLQSAVRRSDLIEALHDGSYFGGNVVKYGLFLPAGMALLFLWASGLWMFWLPIAARRRPRGGGATTSEIGAAKR